MAGSYLRLVVLIFTISGLLIPYRRVKLVGVALYFVIKISRNLNLAAIL